jgi:hypothetical protein
MMSSGKPLKLLLSGIFAFLVLPLLGKPPVLSATKIQKSPPPRVIRVCCSLGSDLGMVGIPFVKINQNTSLEKIGPHHYMGDSDEGNGIIYTKRGGFIDMAHLRDQADWTAYLYLLINLSKGKDTIEYSMGKEGGEKILKLMVPLNTDSLDIMILAGRIAYDLSIWHEIATGFGESSVPLISERFSSFSIEDAYSNLLGAKLGMKALKSELPYDEAMTTIISNTMDSLGVVQTEAETYTALEDVRNIWWTREARLPSNKITLKRLIKVYPDITPMLVPGWTKDNTPAVKLTVPYKTIEGQNLTELYQLKISLSHKFPKHIKREITQDDFDYLIDEVAKSLEN